MGAVIVAAAVGLLLYAARSEGAVTPPPADDVASDPLPSPSTMASLWVDAPSSGASVFVDGLAVGVVPLWVDSLAQGLRRVEVIAEDGQMLADTTVSVLAGDVVDLDFGGDRRRQDDLFAAAAPTDSQTDRATPVTRRPPPDEPSAAPSPRPARDPQPATPRAAPRTASRPAASQPARPPASGGLMVTSSPAGAGVRIDGRVVGVTPVTVRDLRPGTYELVVGTAGYETEARTVEVRSARLSEAAVQLRRFETQVATRTEAPRARPDPPPAPRSTSTLTGTVEVLVRPWGRIVIDGATHQRETDVVYRTVLSAGEHRVTASHPQFGSVTRTVVVPADGTLRVEFDLARDGN